MGFLIKKAIQAMLPVESNSWSVLEKYPMTDILYLIRHVNSKAIDFRLKKEELSQGT